MAALKYWVWFTTLPGLTNRSKLLLLEHFPSPEDIYYAQPEDLPPVEGLSSSQAALLSDKSTDRAEDVLTHCAKGDIFLLTMQDALYPDRLRNIYDPPVLLYGRGRMPLFDEEAAVSVVSTRTCTPYGISAAEELGYQLAKEGAVVVSGLAKGIDGASHRGALRAGGFTAAVLGGGVDVVYPAENRRLYEDIAATGVLLSEYPPGTEPMGSHFPVRNRILSGLSLAVLVVEAPERSGALITANTALEQGRDVFAVPGPIDAPNSRGSNRLIRDGAGLVTCGWDILEGYRSRFPHRLRPSSENLPPVPEQDSLPAQRAEESSPAKPEKKETPPALPVLDLTADTAGLTDDQIRILQVLTTDAPLLTDDVAERADLPIRRVLSALTVLEIDGYATQHGARRFVRTVEIRL